MKRDYLPVGYSQHVNVGDNPALVCHPCGALVPAANVADHDNFHENVWELMSASRACS